MTTSGAAYYGNLDGAQLTVDEWIKKLTGEYATKYPTYESLGNAGIISSNAALSPRQTAHNEVVNRMLAATKPLSASAAQTPSGMPPALAAQAPSEMQPMQQPMMGLDTAGDFGTQQTQPLANLWPGYSQSQQQQQMGTIADLYRDPNTIKQNKPWWQT